MLFRDEPDVEVVAEARSGEEAIQVAMMHKPDVVLMDLVMPEGGGGVEATRRVRALLPRGAHELRPVRGAEAATGLAHSHAA